MQSPQQVAEPRFEPYSSGSSAPPSAGSASMLYSMPPYVRNLQPKLQPFQPPAPIDPSIQRFTPIIPELLPKRRGRGRPSKEQVEADRRAYEARGEQYPRPKPSRKRKEEATSPPLTTYPMTGTNTPYSTAGSEQGPSVRGSYVSPVDREYTTVKEEPRGEPLRDPRDPNRWAQTVGFSTASSSVVRQPPLAVSSSDAHRGILPPLPPQFASSPRIVKTQQDRTHSHSPSANYRQNGGQ